MNKGNRSVYRIAKIMNISLRRIRERYNALQKTGWFLIPKKPGRRPRLVSDEERNLILDIRREHPISGAVALEKILDSMGVHIPHNRIHRILRGEGLALDEPRKQRRLKWIRYERRFSNSLWHADLFEEKPDQIILFEDDASRFITVYRVFYIATAKNSMLVLEQAIQCYGISRQLMTDHCVQFISLPR